MRIAAKRLRYTMEVYKPAYEGRLDDSLEIVKRLQTLLGELHDCDVWLERLPTMLDEERARIVRRYGHPGPLNRLEPGIRYLQEERQRQREVLFRQLGDYWSEQTRLGIWEKIARAAHEQGQNQRRVQQIIVLQADSRNSGESGSVKLGGNVPLEHKASEPSAAGSSLPRAMVGCTPER